MLSFYDVNAEYVDYLRQYDSRVPHIRYDTNDKFVCGVVLQVAGFQYFAPVSHMAQKQRTNILIYHRNIAIASIRFSFMFPALNHVLTRKDFGKIAEKNPKYANLLETELAYCSAHAEKIYQKAAAVYKIGCNRTHYLNKVCCDFKTLEQACIQYSKVIRSS